MHASFSRLEDESWGIKVQDGVRLKVLPGDEVDVRKKDGEIRRVRLGEKVAVWNGRDLIFRIQRDREPESSVIQLPVEADTNSKPKSKVTKADQAEAIEDAKKLLKRALKRLDEVS